MIMLGAAAITAFGLAWAAARCPLGRALTIGLASLGDAPGSDLP